MYSALSKKTPPPPVSPIVALPLKQVKFTFSRFLSKFSNSDTNIAAGAIATDAPLPVDSPVSASTIKTLYDDVSKGALFKEGLLQLSQRILSLTNTSNPSVAIKRSYSRPTPHLLLVEPALAWDPSALLGVGSVAVDRLEEMYRRMHIYLAEAGIDGVKVDAQSGIGAFGVGNGGGSTIAQACVRAVENSAKIAFTSNNEIGIRNPLGGQGQGRVGLVQSLMSWTGEGLGGHTDKILPSDQGQGGVGLIGCMCHSTENLLNYYETSLARASDDFYPKDMAAQTVHLVSCAYNSVMLGEIATMDWDMFHSKHPFAGMHAAARAVSGGPVYVSDSPGNHDADLLRRLVLPDGGIIRARVPARPTVDCLFKDVQRDGISGKYSLLPVLFLSII